MRETVSQYIHIQCDAYALLLNTEYIEEVVGGAVAAENCTSDTGLKTLEWRDLHLPIIDLSEILSLKTLFDLNNKIQEKYFPGANFTIFIEDFEGKKAK